MSGWSACLVTFVPCRAAPIRLPAASPRGYPGAVIAAGAAGRALWGRRLRRTSTGVVINPRPVGGLPSNAPRWGLPSNAPRWGGAILTPLRSREPRNVATSGKRRWIALGVNSLKHVNFVENRGHRAGQTEVKGQILLFLQWRLLRQKSIAIIHAFFSFWPVLR